MRIYLLILFVAFIASCKTSGDFASNIQKRKYTKGYFLDRTPHENKPELNNKTEDIVNAELEKPKVKMELISGLNVSPLLISADTLKKEVEPNKVEEPTDEYLISKPDPIKQNYETTSSNPYEEEPSRRKVNPLSLISLGLLALSIFIFWMAVALSITALIFLPLITGIAALVTAILSLSIRKFNDKSEYFGKGFSIAAVIGSGVFMVFYLIVLLILLLILAIIGSI